MTDLASLPSPPSALRFTSISIFYPLIFTLSVKKTQTQIIKQNWGVNHNWGSKT